MKKLLLIYIALLFIVGCKSNEKKFDSIEIMAYYRGFRVQNDTTETKINKIYCRFYAFVDIRGKAKINYQDSYNGNDIKYVETQIDKNKINELADSLIKLKTFNNLSNSKELMYDGPSIIIRITKDNISKTVGFIDNIDSTNAVYVNFYKSIKAICKSDKNTLSIDTVTIKSKKDEFIIWTLKQDYLIYPKPPPPSNPDKYDTPKLFKHTKK